MTIDVVIFDMGGVVVELGPISDVVGQDGRSADELWSAWLTSDAVRQFEMGRCSPAEFGVALADELGGSLEPELLIDRFRAWPKGLFDGAAELVQSLSPVVEVGLLSNTNRMHWSSQEDGAEIRGLFPRAYLSFELGLAKPDAEIFQFVARDLDVAASRILFLDDNAINVDAARSAGWTAEVAQGVTGAKAALLDRGLLATEP